MEGWFDTQTFIFVVSAVCSTYVIFQILNGHEDNFRSVRVNIAFCKRIYRVAVTYCNCLLHCVPLHNAIGIVHCAMETLRVNKALHVIVPFAVRILLFFDLNEFMESKKKTNDLSLLWTFFSFWQRKMTWWGVDINECWLFNHDSKFKKKIVV